MDQKLRDMSLPEAHYGHAGVGTPEPFPHGDECDCQSCCDDDDHEDSDGSVEEMLGFDPRETDEPPAMKHHKEE